MMTIAVLRLPTVLLMALLFPTAAAGPLAAGQSPSSPMLSQDLRTREDLAQLLRDLYELPCSIMPA